MYRVLLSLIVVSVSFTGCKSTASTPTPISPSSPSTGPSLAEMEAQYAKLRAANESYCLHATPAEIRARQAECAAQRHAMAPLGNAVMEAEIKEAQRHAQQ